MLQTTMPASPLSQACYHPPGHRVGRSLAVAEALTDPQVNLAIWRRSLPVHVVRAMERWVAQAEMNVDCIVPAESPELGEVVAHVRVPRLRQYLLGDLQMLFGHLVRLTASTQVRVVLAIKRTNACRKFHTDHVRLRLITTYAGPGTEWAPNEAVDRDALACPPDCPHEANHAIVRELGAIEQSQAGDVLLLKGDRWAGALGAVHRSPPIEGTNQSRLVMSLTTVAEDA